MPRFPFLPFDFHKGPRAIRSDSNDTLVPKGVHLPPLFLLRARIRVIPRIRRKLRGYSRRKREFSNCYPQLSPRLFPWLVWGEATHTCRFSSRKDARSKVVIKIEGKNIECTVSFVFLLSRIKPIA